MRDIDDSGTYSRISSIGDDNSLKCRARRSAIAPALIWIACKYEKYLLNF